MLLGHYSGNLNKNHKFLLILFFNCLKINFYKEQPEVIGSKHFPDLPNNNYIKADCELAVKKFYNSLMRTFTTRHALIHTVMILTSTLWRRALDITLKLRHYSPFMYA